MGEVWKVKKMRKVVAGIAMFDGVDWECQV